MKDFHKILCLADTPSGLDWLPPKPRCMLNKVGAGSRKPDGYWQVMVGGKHYYTHRVVAVLSGIIPQYDTAKYIDHLDGDTNNNRPANLAAVSHRANMQI